MTREPGSREEDAWLSDAQLARCAPAEEEPFQAPVPTRMMSSGEFMPYQQTTKQKRVEARVKELAEAAAKKLGITRRKFLAGSGGLAASFIAMNEAFGSQFFNVDADELFDAKAHARNAPPRDLFVFEGQSHMLRSSRSGKGGALRALAQGPGSASTAAGFPRNPFNPAGNLDELGNPWTAFNPDLGQRPQTEEDMHVVKYIHQLFFESQVTVGILSANNVALLQNESGGFDAPKNVTESLKFGIINPEQAISVRNFVNKISGSKRLLAHGFLAPGIGNLHDPVYGDFMQYQIDKYEPDAWKGYNVYPNAKTDLDPESLMKRWRLDDEKVAYPMFDVIVRNKRMLKKRPGFFNICLHKGFTAEENDDPEHGNPRDIPKAARDWPQLNFIIYHSCIKPNFFMFDALEEIKSGKLRRGVPDITWISEFIQIAAPLRNVYAEIGSTFAITVTTFPTVWAHVIGQMLKFIGEDRILWGGETPFYGSPQWQIEALWRYQIPEGIRRKYGYPKITDQAKRKMLGLNAARIYGVDVGPRSGLYLPHDHHGHGHGHGHGHHHGHDFCREHERKGLYKPIPSNYEQLIPNSLKRILEFPGYTTDNIAKMQKIYAEFGGERSNTRYGWIRSDTHKV